MKSGKIIDVSKSSLVSLKAELLRKQEEAQKTKGAETYLRPAPKKKIQLKVNPGVEDRSRNDEISEQEVDLLKRSREVLHVKSKLYDKLQKGESVQEDVGDPYLVNFKEKLDKVFSEGASTSSQTQDKTGEASPQVSDTDDLDDDDDEGWVDYVDCMGRTRRCLKEDLDAVKEKDEALRKSLGYRVGAKGSCDKEDPSEVEPAERQLEMVSNDMQREAMREKWEEQEQELVKKKNVYYEDIRFDEARSHGVAYYSFSTEENKREEEQAELKRAREETLAKQREAREVKQRRDMMKQSRLMAARQRQRARLGLPLLPTDIDIDIQTEPKKEETAKVEDKEEESYEEVEAALARAAHVRPWDVGKDGVAAQTAKVLTQEEWIERKRTERPEEFAPPSETQVPSVRRNKKNRKKDNKRKNKSEETYVESDKYGEEADDVPGPWPRADWNPPVDHSPSSSRQSSDNTSPSRPHSTRGAAVPPPPMFEYYNPTSKSSTTRPPQTTVSSKQMIESIEAGLQYLRYQSDKRDKIVSDKNQQLM